MSGIRKVGSLEIDHDLGFDERQSRVQRVAWWVMLALVVAALAGLFGGGRLSHARAGLEGAALSLEYERFQRHRRTTRLLVSLAPQPGAPGSLGVWLDRDFIEQYQVEAIVPEPTEQSVAGERIVFTFTRHSPERSTRIAFDLLPGPAGARQGRIGLEGGPELHFRVFVYP